jgi:alpha-L-fucosidase
MGWREKQVNISALGLASPQNPGKIQKVELLGNKSDLKWKQNEAGLNVEMPAEKISDVAITLKVKLA